MHTKEPALSAGACFWFRCGYFAAVFAAASTYTQNSDMLTCWHQTLSALRGNPVDPATESILAVDEASNNSKPSKSRCII
jgi:hypothetical protein